MYGSETFAYKRDSSVFGLVQVESTDETTGFIDVVYLELTVTLHVPAARELECFRAIRFALLRCIAGSARCANATEDKGKDLVILWYKKSA